MIKLNLGAGPCVIPGWDNLDKFPQAPGTIQCDVLEGLPYEDNSVDLIYASHLLEHFNIVAGIEFLRECRRVLKPGGIIRISVPDLGLALEKWVRKELDDYADCQPEIYQTLNDDNKLACFLFGALSGQPEYTGHQHAYTKQGLAQALKAAGFSSAYRMRPGRSRSPIISAEVVDYHPKQSLIVEAVK